MDFLNRKKRKAVVLPKQPVGETLPADSILEKAKKWTSTYKIQIYWLILVSGVGLLVYLATGLVRYVSEEANVNFTDLSAPSFPISSVTIDSYDLGELKLDKKVPGAYKLESELTSKVSAAAAKLGFASPPQENKYTQSLLWSEGERQLKYYYNLNKVSFEGGYSTIWVSESDILSGIENYFEINTQNYNLLSRVSDDRLAFWRFGYNLDSFEIFYGSETALLQVTTTNEGSIVSFELTLIEIIDTKKIKTLEIQDVTENLATLPKRVEANVTTPIGPEGLGKTDASVPISNPKGAFLAESISYGLYIDHEQTSFLTPVLCLKGILNTVDGLSGEAIVLVDIVDWEKL